MVTASIHNDEDQHSNSVLDTEVDTATKMDDYMSRFIIMARLLIIKKEPECWQLAEKVNRKLTSGLPIRTNWVIMCSLALDSFTSTMQLILLSVMMLKPLLMLLILQKL